MDECHFEENNTDVMEDTVRVLLLVCLMSLSSERGSSFTFCKESATKIRYVSKCPTDTKSWDIAAKKMNCETIKQNCSSSINHRFQYHCVINQFRNTLLEVCALNRTIFGYCSEYNTMGKVIQEHYGAECTKHDPPCPILYNSAESYKYPACYQLAKGTNRNIEIKLNLKQQSLQSSSHRCRYTSVDKKMNTNELKRLPNTQNILSDLLTGTCAYQSAYYLMFSCDSEKQSLAQTSCGISVLTVNYVKQCPTDAISWKMAAERMNCESINHNCLSNRRLNTTPAEFQFHCLINAWINATLEVCAFNRTIIGHCAEFNIGGSTVQDNYDADCTKHDPPCPSSYNSAESYKYETCYKLVAQHRKKTHNVLKSSSKRWFGHLAPIVLSLFLTLIMETAFSN